jgi:two-component system, OmpR family, sensor histidine kinase BaeS
LKLCLVWVIGWCFVPKFVLRSLAVRLSLSMVAVALLIVLLVVGLENLAFLREYRQLPASLRQPIFRQNQDEQAFLDEVSPRLQQAYLERVDLYQKAFNDFRRARRRSIFLSTVIALLLGTLLAVVLARRISRPIAAVSKAANEMQQGKLSARVDLQALKNADEETFVLSQSFNALAETLEKNELERKNMIADIAHELRTPLAVMQARLAAMQDEVIPLNPTEIERVYKQTELLSRLVTDLRTLSLAEAGRLSFNRQRIDVTKLLEHVVATFETTATSKNVLLILDAKESAFVEADSDRLTQVFSNLLDNALRYTPVGESVRVGLEVDAKLVRVYVCDAGPGLSEEALNKVFDRFYKGDERSGSGLGLAIVKALVEVQGGAVTAKNHLEGGTVFEVRLTKV